ncbi:MAG TPA: pyridoxal-dependent decarboxylase, partial [Longimicrobiaceae bacterium]|nr:pyridoxal-dependent decarboxylase [Longimicrobiaceae bacterium]
MTARDLGDMSPEELREQGHRVIDWIASYLEGAERRPVLSRAAPGEVARSLPSEPPRSGQEFAEILEVFDHAILPGITHWNHPGFMAYFGITGSGPGILGEALAAALNVNAMLWRTSPAATELEEVTLDWLRQMVGLPGEFRGHIQDTASTSTMVALAAAREAASVGAREEGLAGRDLPRLVIYCSEEAHSSVDRAAITLGLGLAGVRRIPTDDWVRMRTDALERSIAADLEAGARPIALVATIGTTSTTSVDPVPELAEIGRRHGLWLHIDAAYAGAAAVVPELRPLFAGWEAADSLVINPHKWLFVPIDCSALFLKRPEVLRRAFAILPDYLTTPEGETVTNLMKYGPALGRRFRALKLWMTIGYFGQEGIAARIAEHVRLARLFAGWVEGVPAWEVVAPVPFSTVCFRFAPAGLSNLEIDRLNAGILDRVNAGGEVFLSHTRLRGRMTLRLAVGNLRTEER